MKNSAREYNTIHELLAQYSLLGNDGDLKPTENVLRSNNFLEHLEIGKRLGHSDDKKLLVILRFEHFLEIENQTSH